MLYGYGRVTFGMKTPLQLTAVVSEERLLLDEETLPLSDEPTEDCFCLKTVFLDRDATRIVCSPYLSHGVLITATSFLRDGLL